MLVLVLVNIASLNIVHNHFCFNDYMERIISSTESQYFHYLHLYLHSFELIVIPCQGSMARTWSRWGSTMRVRRTTWTASSSAPTSSGTVRSFKTNLENWKTVCLRVLSEAGGGPSQTQHRPGEQHHPHPFVILFILVYGRLMMIIQVNTGVLDTVLLSFHPAEVNNYMWLPTKTNLILRGQRRDSASSSVLLIWLSLTAMSSSPGSTP